MAARIIAAGGVTLSELPAYTWDAIYRRLQSIATEHPIGVVKVDLQLMLLDGKPVMWFEPETVRLEPKRSGLQFLGLLRDQHKMENPP